jgi:hypothetical protein
MAGEGGDIKPDGRTQTEWAIFFSSSSILPIRITYWTWAPTSVGPRPSPFLPWAEPVLLLPILCPSSRILIVEINPHQLALIVVILGIGVMNLTTFSPSLKSTLKINGNKITFGIALLQGLGVIGIFLILIYAPYQKNKKCNKK